VVLWDEDRTPDTSQHHHPRPAPTGMRRLSDPRFLG
jgi:hypothetical protein